MLEFSVKSCQNSQNTLIFFRKKKNLRSRCWSEFNGICKNTHA